MIQEYVMPILALFILSIEGTKIWEVLELKELCGYEKLKVSLHFIPVTLLSILVVFYS